MGAHTRKTVRGNTHVLYLFSSQGIAILARASVTMMGMGITACR